MKRTRYIFSINPGRSGSHYMCQLLGCAADCRALHEPDPRLTGPEMLQFNRGDEAPMRRLIPQKVAAIQQAARGQVYAETSHFFIMGFGWLLPEHLDEEEMAVIVIRRDPVLVGQSWFRIHRVPGTHKARSSVLSPDGSFNVTRPEAGAAPLDLCIWHAREVYARIPVFQSRFPRVKVLDIDLEGLNDSRKVHDLFDALGLEPTESLASAIGVATNLKKRRNAVSRAFQRLCRSVKKRLPRAGTGCSL